MKELASVAAETLGSRIGCSLGLQKARTLVNVLFVTQDGKDKQRRSRVRSITCERNIRVRG